MKVIDPYKRRFFFPIKSCRTLFVRGPVCVHTQSKSRESSCADLTKQELNQLVSEQCLDDISLDVDQHDLVHDKEICTGQNWMEIVRQQKYLIITICVVEKKETRNSRVDNYLAVILNPNLANIRRRSTTSSTSATGSDVEGSESSTEEEGLGPYIAQKTNGRSEGTPSLNAGNSQLMNIRPRGSPSPRRLSKERRENVEKIQKLTRGGLIINEPDSLATDKKVKMFRIEPETKDSDSRLPDNSSGNLASVAQASKKAYVSDEPEDIPQKHADVPDANGNKRSLEPKNLVETPKLSLRAPPCFTWNLEGSGITPDHKVPNKDSFDPTGLKHILSKIGSRIAGADYDLMGKSSRGYDGEEYFEGGRFYRDTPSLSYEELTRLRRSLKETLAKLLHRRSILVAKARP